MVEEEEEEEDKPHHTPTASTTVRIAPTFHHTTNAATAPATCLGSCFASHANEEERATLATLSDEDEERVPVPS